MYGLQQYTHKLYSLCLNVKKKSTSIKLTSGANWFSSWFDDIRVMATGWFRNELLVSSQFLRITVQQGYGIGNSNFSTFSLWAMKYSSFWFRVFKTLPSFSDFFGCYWLPYASFPKAINCPHWFLYSSWHLDTHIRLCECLLISHGETNTDEFPPELSVQYCGFFLPVIASAISPPML